MVNPWSLERDNEEDAYSNNNRIMGHKLPVFGTGADNNNNGTQGHKLPASLGLGLGARVINQGAKWTDKGNLTTIDNGNNVLKDLSITALAMSSPLVKSLTLTLLPPLENMYCPQYMIAQLIIL